MTPEAIKLIFDAWPIFLTITIFLGGIWYATRKNRDDIEDLSRRMDHDHAPQIDRNRKDIAELKNTLGRIDERTTYIATTNERIFDKLDHWRER